MFGPTRERLRRLDIGRSHNSRLRREQILAHCRMRSYQELSGTRLRSSKTVGSVSETNDLYRQMAQIAIKHWLGVGYRRTSGGPLAKHQYGVQDLPSNVDSLLTLPLIQT